jgi:hypothetical protein
LIEQSASLPGSDRARARSSARQLARLAARLARGARRDRLRDDLLRLVGFSSRNSASFWLTRLLDEAAHPRVAELRLRLALELRLAQLHGDDRGEALADVLALEVLVLLLEQPLSRA